MRMELGLEAESSTSYINQFFTSNYWHYAKQFVKGAGVFTVGLAGYFGMVHFPGILGDWTLDKRMPQFVMNPC